MFKIPFNTEFAESLFQTPVDYSLSDINATTLQCVMVDKCQRFLKTFHHATQISFTRSLDNNDSCTSVVAELFK